MASIQEYLDLIKNAIYGKDVRQAIHDAILQCYLDASGDHYQKLDVEVNRLKSNKVNQPLDGNNQPTNGTNGQSLRTKGDGTTEWADVGLPSDQQTAEAVSAWLDNHPEATTTVVDGSLTEAKFSNSLQLKAIKDYVTPEMFGAKGDGITDDSDALATVFGMSNVTIALTGLYAFSNNITFGESVTVIGNDSAGLVFADSNACLKLNRGTVLSGFYIKLANGFVGNAIDISNLVIDEVIDATTKYVSSNIVIDGLTIQKDYVMGYNSIENAIFNIHNEPNGLASGFWGVRIQGCKFIGSIKYFCKCYVNSGWITDLVMSDNIVNGAGYFYFGAEDETKIGDVDDCIGVTLNNNSFQWNDSNAFVLFATGYKHLINNYIWDVQSGKKECLLADRILNSSYIITIDSPLISLYSYFGVYGNTDEGYLKYVLDKYVKSYVPNRYIGGRYAYNTAEYTENYRLLDTGGNGTRYYEAKICVEGRNFNSYLQFFQSNTKTDFEISLLYAGGAYYAGYHSDTDFMSDKKLYFKVDDYSNEMSHITVVLEKNSPFPASAFYRCLSKGIGSPQMIFETKSSYDLTGFTEIKETNRGLHLPVLPIAYNALVSSTIAQNFLAQKGGKIVYKTTNDLVETLPVVRTGSVSITSGGTAVTFDVAMPSADYAVLVESNDYTVTNKTTTGFKVSGASKTAKYVAIG